MNRKQLLAGILVAVLVISLSGCNYFPVSTNDGNKEAREKVLIYGSNDYTSINPALYEHGEINSLLFNGLTAHNGKNEVIPALAKSWEFEEETNSYVFILNSEVKFQDGKPFTAEDVKFTLDTIRDPKNQSEIASNYEDITNIEILDPYRIQITLKAPNVAMLDYLSIGILPKHRLEGKDIRTDDFNSNPIGTGPYKLTKWDRGQSITLEKNPYFYGNAPKIDKVIFKIVEDTSVRALQLKSGELDLAQITPKDAVSFAQDPNFIINEMETADYRGVLFNFNHPLFRDNKGLVNALSLVIDRQLIVDSVLLEKGEIAYSPLQKGSYNYPEIQELSYDPVLAEKELNVLGWWKNKKGMFEKNGDVLAFTISCMEGDQVRIDMAAICAQQWREFGVDVNISVEQKIDWEGQEAFLIGWGSPFDPDDHTYKVFGTNKGSNLNAYSNKTVDELLQRARETETQEERLKLYWQFQQELAKDLPYTFLAYVNVIYIQKPGISGITPSTILGHHGVGIFWNIADWDME